VTVTVSTKVATILIVSWTQATAADQTFLEFSFAGSTVMTSRAKPGTTGSHKDYVLGVPGSTAVTLRVVSRVGTTDYKTHDYTGTTGAVPSGMPKPTVSMFDATRASPERYMVGAVENSPNTCTNDSCYFVSTWWVYILDRQGRVVWYYADGTSTDVSSFPQKARDGEYLFFEKRAFSTSGTPSVLKMTLDRETYSASVMVPQLSDGVDMTSDGSLLYDTEERTRPNSELRQMTRDGTVTTIWRCPTTGMFNNCYSNVVSWDPATDTVLLSFPESNNIAQIDRKTGTLVATYGSGTGSYSFSPSPWSFVWQHYANISPQGTLLVSSHLPQYTKDSAAGPNQHAFEEFMIDRTNKRLTRVWIYGDSTSDGSEWAASRGEAVRLSNGNTLVNYGTGGVIREVTPDKKTVFYVKFDITSSNDFFNKLVGHQFLLDDLYALNGGGPK
jgi:Arylsulfotransferase (ASST)